MSGGAGGSVLVVVVAYQSGAYLQACIDSLAAQEHARFEAVIVDNASTDGSVRDLRLPDDRFRIDAAGANLGFAAAVNRAAADGAGHTWLALLNPDAEADPGWLRHLLAAAGRHPEAHAFGATQLRLADPDVLDGAGDRWFFAGVAWRAREGRPAASAELAGAAFGPCGAAAMYRMETFRTLGGFYEPYFCYLEDVDMAFRMRLRGHDCIQAPGAVVRHAGSGVTGRTSDFTLFHGHRNRIWTFLKDTPAPVFWPALPLHILLNLYLLLRAWPKGYAGVMWRAYRAAWRGRGAVWRDRKAVQAGRTAPALQVARAMTWSPFAVMRRI